MAHNQRRGAAQQLVTTLSGCSQFQRDPEGDGDEPSRRSNLTGSGVRCEGMVPNVGLCNEMRTVCKHGGWRTRDVRGDMAAGVVVLAQEKGGVRKLRSTLLAQKL